jgi:hypothetical protein
MDHVIDQIKGTYDAGFPFAALMIALTVPDICANLELPPAATNERQQARYKRWFNANLATRITRITADDCWSLRCGVVHESVFGNKDQKFDRVFFTLGPGEVSSSGAAMISTETGEVSHSEGRVVGLSLPKFLNDICAAVAEWSESKREDLNVQRNLLDLVRPYPKGVPGRIPGFTYSYGGACIA